MAGTPRGRVDAYLNLAYTDYANCQYPFSFIYQFFLDMQTAGYCTIIATNYGFIRSTPTDWGGPPGSGMDVYSGSNPSGENAWFLVRYDVSTARPGGAGNLGAYYCLFQWSGSKTFGLNDGGSPNGTDGYPGRVAYYGGNFDGVACSVAFRTDGASPWNGTTDAGEGTPGQAQKGNPVWDDGATGTLRVMDVANGPGGSYVTAKQNMMTVVEIYYVSAGPRRYHMIGDEDSFWFVCDDTSKGNEWDNEWFSCSVFEPLSGHPNGYPLIIMSDSDGLPPSKGLGYGLLDGSSRYENGAIVAPDAFGNVVGRVIPHGYPGNLDGSSTYAPQRHLSDDTQKTYLECPNWLEFYEGGGTGTDLYTPIGSKAWMAEVYNVPPASMSSNGLRLFMNNDTTNVAQRTAFPWNGAFPPGMRSNTSGLGYAVP
jgi:hypothetical protein